MLLVLNTTITNCNIVNCFPLVYICSINMNSSLMLCMLFVFNLHYFQYTLHIKIWPSMGANRGFEDFNLEEEIEKTVLKIDHD